jgi:hypothetical protein
MEPYRLLDVKVRSRADAAGGCRWHWQVLEDGQLIETASLSYDTEAAAQNAGNAAARGIRKRALTA